MAAEPLITTYLEMRSRDQLRPKRADARFQVREKTNAIGGSIAISIFVSASGGTGSTNDHGRMSNGRIRTAEELWTFRGILWRRPRWLLRTSSGRENGIEIAYFGLLPEWIGRGLGGALLTSAIEGAWRTEPNPSRVWVHTCNRDHPQALANYQARGMIVYKVEEEAVGGTSFPGEAVSSPTEQPKRFAALDRWIRAEIKKFNFLKCPPPKSLERNEANQINMAI